MEGLLARTGYTGEDGFEFYFSPNESQRVWNALLDAGKAEGLVAAGLGARNTLRLEAGYRLYGHELDEETTLLEANLGWIAKLEKGDKIETLMKELSEDPGSAKTGEGYDVTPDAGLVPPFKNLALRLNKGEVGVVKTEFGIHIIQRVE